eukprot:CAMPEP_0205832014 /NCGR_PEP_ID=MMETSP0206-20130828/45764_1 /ASSEMBLY_ACC=CAM_ASM_000279 /TAXON_ID=36767 /ORGANISM="Euplotes focardii, Strain TN1" /LENGTH=354 /DNA_ID=CAMNT_0053137171 /DNA_START=41 /DNA_END=1101 /DNA_ORIENTATION=-
MVFILEQRLRAQNVEKEKAQKVLQEILKFMFNKSFLEELFKPQDRHSYTATKHLFTKLAHSSVMKLNENSMSKLFDLMVMGVKFQIISTTIPEEIYHVTLRHLEEVFVLIEGTSAEEYVHDCKTQLINMCKGFTAYDFTMIKQNLLSFFQDRHVKVSLFIQEKIQSLDGTLNIFHTGIGPIYSQKPGVVTYFDKNGEVRDTDELNLKSGDFFEQNTFKKRLEGSTDPNLGLNMYAEERKALCTRPKSEGEVEVSQSQKPTIKKPSKEDSKASEDITQKEYNFIASMIRKDDAPQEKIKITFPGEIKAAGGAGTSEINTINIDVSDSSIKKKESMMKEFGDMEIQQDNNDDEDDL